MKILQVLKFNKNISSIADENIGLKQNTAKSCDTGNFNFLYKHSSEGFSVQETLFCIAIFNLIFCSFNLSEFSLLTTYKKTFSKIHDGIEILTLKEKIGKKISDTKILYYEDEIQKVSYLKREIMEFLAKKEIKAEAKNLYSKSGRICGLELRIKKNEFEFLITENFASQY